MWVINLTNDCEIKSDKYQAMPTWSYQCQCVWILLDDFFNVQVYNCSFGGPPPNLRSWSTWALVKHPPFSMAAFRTNLVAKPCKRQKVALEPFLIAIRPCLPGVINAKVSEYSSVIFLMYMWTMALLGDHPPNRLSWSTWWSLNRPPFSIAAFKTNLVAKPC